MLTKLRSWLRSKDPDHRALRRGSRVAIAVPLTLAILLNLPWVSQGALMGAFACLSGLVFADFGGPLRQRFFAYMVTTLAGIPLIAIGAFAGQQRWTAVVAMAAVAMVVGMLAVLRGLIAAAQSVLLLSMVLALTASTPALVLPDLASWCLGGLAAACAAVFLWPSQPNLPIPGLIADVLDAVADASDVRWVTRGTHEELMSARDRVNTAIVALHAKYDGNLLRPSGITNADRALAELVDEVSRLRYLQRWEDVAEHKDPQVVEMTAHLCSRISDALRACAGRLRGSKQPLSSAAIFDIRTENLDQTADWLAEHRHNHSPGYLREQIEDTFPVRVTTLITSRITDQTIAVKPRPGDETSDPPSVLATAAEGPPTAVERLRMHLSWNSPWFRSAVRSAVALSLSIAVAKSVSLQHPFWIVLGTLSALRFDALGTGRTAKQALIGTTAGVALSAVCIQLFGGNQVIWWILFPIALFWAAYTPGTLSFAVGQAGFSFVVIVMFSILSPVRLDTAAARLIDVVLGLAISLVVSLLMWPRGVVETLYTRLREAMQAACDYYVASADWMAGGAVNDRLLAEYKSASESALDRAQEALDLSIAQRPPKAVALQRWTALANTVHHVDFASRLMPQAVGIIRLRGDQTPLPIQLSGPLMAGANNAREELMAATNAWCDLQPAFDDDSTAGGFDGALPEFETAPTVRDLRQAIDDYLATPDDWHGTGSDPRPVVATWLTDWTALFDRSAQVLRIPA